MACTSQSAVEYVRRARLNLVRTLKGLTTVIVENLYQRGVFSEKEVSEIKAEGDDFDKSRRIVESVIKKGEAACYEFLRIIDITRKRSTESSPSVLENTETDSSLKDKFDLSYWISCFSFKEDTNMDVTYLQGPSPCHRYQQKLKSKAQKISERSWTQSKAVLFNKETSLSYTSLVLDTQRQASISKIKKSKIKKSRKVRTKKLKAYIPEDKQETSPSELLKMNERKILLVGKPGIGKTAVVHQMLKLWSEKDNKDLDYMFYFDMRETPNITEVHKLEDLLFSVINEPDEGKDVVLENIKNNADSVTIIFDGVTDIPSTSVVFKLIQKTLVPEAKIIITCRPEVESADFLLGWDCLRVEVKGFSEQGIREYLSKNLSEEHFSKVLCNLELFSLCHVPMYALMVVACFSFEGSNFSPHPCTVTEIYLNILHFCNERNVCKISENESTKWDAVLSLSEAAFYATEGKNVNLKSLPKLESCAHLAFLSRSVTQVSPTAKKPLYTFLHYTVQEFFAALWVLKDPERTRSVVQQCLTDDIKHMKHLVPFLCGLLNEKNMDLLQFLFTSQHLRETSGWFFKHLVTTFVDRSDTEDCEIDLLFLCQCLYESQSAEACVYLLDKLDYCLDLSGETLDPQQCYAVSYIISQSKERKIQLNLEKTKVSKQGMRPLLGCLSKLQSSQLSWQLWTICLLSEVEVDYISLLRFAENQLHLSVNSQPQLYDQAGKVLQKSAEKVKVCLHWDHRSSVDQSVSELLLQCLPNIHSLSVDTKTSDEDRTRFFVNLFCAAAEREQQTGEKILELLSSVCTYQTFPFDDTYMNDDMKKYQSDFLLDLCSHMKDCETKTGLSVLPSLQSVFSAPAVWSINLSERKTSTLLEVLKLQPEKKQVELTQYTHKKSKIRSFLQCLPYISQLSVDAWWSHKEKIRFFVNLFCAAAEREQQTGEKILELLSSVCTYQTFPFDDTYMNDDMKKYQSDFLFDLYSHLKDYETKTGLSVLPSLQSVFQSAPAVWSIKLSERKTSILLEVLKLQPEKKQVELTGCSHEESEVRSFLQCLPYISQLSAVPQLSEHSEEIRFFVNLFCAAAEREQQTGEKILELLSSVCRYKGFLLKELWCDFLLDVYSYQTKTGLSVLPSLQSVFQSAPAVWSINLSERKTSILLEVLKLQPEKKHVELTGCSHEESEVRSFLQCLPYITELSFKPQASKPSEETRFFVNLFCAAAEREQQTGEKILELLSSVCTYQTFTLKQKWCDFLLDLYPSVLEMGLSAPSSLQSVFQSAPAVWFINLSERKTSILLEVLKLQPEKKQLNLTGWSHEENEERHFLQCLPYISKLSFGTTSSESSEAVRFFGNLFCAAAEREQQTGEKILELLSSVCRYKGFPLKEIWCDFLMDLYYYTTKTGLSVLPSLQSVFQSAPAVWFINLSKRKTSILLEVLKLQPEKKQVELTGCSHDESEVRSFLQCLPYISQLSVVSDFSESSEEIRFIGNLIYAAAERKQWTGEKILELLSTVCTYKGFPLREILCDFLLDLYSSESEMALRVLFSLQSVFSAPAVWSINLSERKISILLEVLKLQPEKKQVELTGCSHEESEVLILLQCLPYISQLSVIPQLTEPSEETRFFGNLFCAAAEREQQTGEKILELLSSVCRYKRFPLKETWCDFLMDLYYYTSKTGLSVLPSLQSVFQSAPAVWSINLSKRKTSILLEVLKLQPEKKQVELTGCSHEESEVLSLLQCLPYISQLSFSPLFLLSSQTKLMWEEADGEQQPGEKILELLSSVCKRGTFPFTYRQIAVEYQCDFLLDLYSYVKDCETKAGLSVLPSLQSVFQSAPAVWSINLSERKTSILLEVLKLQPEKKHVELTGCSHEESEVRSFLQCLPYISQLSVEFWDRGEAVRFFVNLFCAAAEREQQTGEKILELLSSVCRFDTFPFDGYDDDDHDLEKYRCHLLLNLCSDVKDCETKTGLSVLPSLQSVFQSAPAVWSINLSKRKTSILLEVLKLQPEKKQVELTGCSHEESEMRSFLQCLPYISQLSVDPEWLNPDEAVRFFVNLFCAAAEREQQTGEKILELLSSVCTYQTFPYSDRDLDYEYPCDFLLDLYSHLKEYETKAGLSVLPSLQSVFQSAPAVWSINLSERKTSILLEVLKLQPEKKHVELTGCSHEESEVLILLQCLPYISQLSFSPSFLLSSQTKLMWEEADGEQQPGEKILELLSSVCKRGTFPFTYRQKAVEYQSDFLLDVYSHVKDCETKTGLSVLPSLQSVFQSAPAVWSINLSERKTSILLEVLKLQPEKKHVELTQYTHKKSKIRSFLQCLPYISQLSVYFEDSDEEIRFFVNLFCAAAEREQQTGEKILELLSSVCSFDTFPFDDRYMDDDDRKYRCDHLLDMCSDVKDCETKTGLSVLPSLQSVFQSAPAVWSINLSERKTSILLEVLKLQPEKKHVELTQYTHKKSKIRSFLQCLPYISQLSVDLWDQDEEIRFFVNLFCAAAEREQRTGEKILELLSSVCRHQNFPYDNTNLTDYGKKCQCDLLLDLYSHVKGYESKTGLSVLPSLQSVFSAPVVWSINLSERKTSILLEVLKLQPEKKQVKLTGCSHEESEVRSFLQCLPYISQLSVDPQKSYLHEAVRFFVNLFCAAAEREQQTGEKILELLSSVCRYKNSPLKEKWCDFLMDLYAYETKTGLSVLPSLQSVFQSAPVVWSINLSERKTSILLEVLKLQPEKIQVKLTGCSHEESEVRSFLQCLPYISQLSVYPQWSCLHEAIRFFVNLFCAAAEREQQTGEKILELLLSVCRYKNSSFEEKWCDFLMDLYCYETKTGLSVLPSLHSVFQSAPAVWSINLSERKTSILLEVLKLQPEKKEVMLTGCSHEESEVRSFLQCLPYISQLSVDLWDQDEETSFFVNLFCAAAEREQQTGEKILELLSSVCTYQTFHLIDTDMDDDYLQKYQSGFLLDLCSYLKDYETKTGLSVLPSLQSVFQSAPAVWSINLSERKTSILLEVLKLQPEKKQVKLTGCSHEESEVRSFLQCLPYISQLR
uniref:NACHT domain-containing protein n=1 Tax=Oreochromis niloticus TaxID=8128 RepID=A0A669D6T8_ORENI